MNIEEILMGIGGGATGAGALGVWLFKRWIQRTDERIDKLQRTVERFAKAAGELNTSIAVAQERQSHLTGRIDQLAKSVESTSANVGTLHASIQKMWMVLKSKDLVPKRFSDEAIEG